MFADRIDAGQKLAEALKSYANKAEVVVYGLPRGGIICAAEVAKALNAPLDLIIVRKIGHPNSPEYAIGAVAEDGCNILSAEANFIDQAYLKDAMSKEATEAKRRKIIYLGKKTKPKETGKVAIIIDDGLATGLTIKLAIMELRHQKPKKIVVAVPVSPRDTGDEVRKEIDEFISLEEPVYFGGSVGMYYHLFPQITDEEVIQSLKEATN